MRLPSPALSLSPSQLSLTPFLTSLPPNFSAVEMFIRNKYERKLYATKTPDKRQEPDKPKEPEKTRVCSREGAGCEGVRLGVTVILRLFQGKREARAGGDRKSAAGGDRKSGATCADKTKSDQVCLPCLAPCRLGNQCACHALHGNRCVCYCCMNRPPPPSLEVVSTVQTSPSESDVSRLTRSDTCTVIR